MTPCQAEPDAWFSIRSEDIAEAKQACRTCPALEACMKLVAETKPDVGVWAGRFYGTGVRETGPVCRSCERPRSIRADGLCSSCYNREVRTGGRNPKPNWTTRDAWLWLKAQGMSRQVAAEMLGVTDKSLYEIDRRIRLKGAAA